MQLWERGILNSEMADARAIFNYAVETSLGIGAAGSVACYGMRKSIESDFHGGIRTRFACSATTLPHFYLRPNCCLFQYVFFSHV